MSKFCKRLYDHEAQYLGFELKTHEKGRTQAKYYVTPKQWQEIKSYRNKGVLDSCEALQVDPTTVKHLWKKTKEESIFIKNPLYVSELEKTYLDLRDTILDDLKAFKPKHL